MSEDFKFLQDPDILSEKPDPSDQMSDDEEQKFEERKKRVANKVENVILNALDKVEEEDHTSECKRTQHEKAADAAMRMEMYEHYLKVVFQSGRPHVQVERYLDAYRVFEDPLSKESKMYFSLEMETYSETYLAFEPNNSVQHILDDAALAAAMLFAPPMHPNCHFTTMSVFLQRDGQSPSPYSVREGRLQNLQRYINICNNEHLPNPVPKRIKRPVAD